MRDAGAVFAVVPSHKVDPKGQMNTLPVITKADGAEYEVATGIVTIRWTALPSEIASLLASQGVHLVRNYGSGGMVRPVEPEGPFELAERLRKLDFVTSASAHTIGRATRR